MCLRGICAFCYMLNLFGVVVFHRSIGQLGGGALVYGGAIFLVQWCHTSMVNCRGVHLSICAFCYMLNLFGVVVFHRSLVN